MSPDSLHQGGGRTQNEAHPAKRGQIARDRPSAASDHLPDQDAAVHGGSPENSLYCNVPIEAVIEAGDVEHTIYEAPLNLQAEGLDEYVCRALNLRTSEPDMSDWRKFVDA